MRTISAFHEGSMEEQMMKIQLCGPDAGELETPWATPIGANQYRLENSPFFAYGVSWEDIVEAHLDEHDCLEFTRFVSKSGNRTVRAIADFSQEPLAKFRLQTHLSVGVPNIRIELSGQS